MRKCLVLFTLCIYNFVSNGQNVGVGVSNPQNKLHVGGGFRLDTLTGVGGAGLLRHDANGVVYGIKFSGNTNDVLRGDGTFGSVAGSGTGSNYWLANGNHIYNSNTGNVGVGTTAPQSKFHANGTSWFTGDNTPLPAAAGKGIAIGQSGENGYIFSFDYSTFIPKNLLLQSPGGNVGIGMTSPTTTLDVNGFIRATNVAGGNIVSETTGGTNSWAKLWMKTPAQQWSIGSSNGFNGNQLYFTNENSGAIQMAIMPSGNVGIGTTNPLAKMHVSGTGIVESSVQSTNERSILSLNSTIAGQNRVWTLENGLFGTAGLFGIYDRTAGQARLSIQPAGPVNVQGNVTQNLEGHGLPKAMVFINGDGTIIRCYNGVAGSTTGGCGFTSNRVDPHGSYHLECPFDLSTSFILISPENGAFEAVTASFLRIITTGIRGIEITVSVSATGSPADRPVMVIIY